MSVTLADIHLGPPGLPEPDWRSELDPNDECDDDDADCVTTDDVWDVLGFGPTDRYILGDFNPYHEPAGSAEGGQFSSGGSEGGSSGASAGSSDDTPGFKVAQGLKAKELAAVVDYSDEGFTDINRYLRTGSGPSGLKYQVEDIGSAIAKSTTTEEQVVYRGMTMGMRGRIKEVKTGEMVWDKGFVSTSKSEQFAKDFAGGKHAVKIILTKGSHALDLGPNVPTQFKRASDTREQEVLLPHGSKFRVESTRPLTLRLVQ